MRPMCTGQIATVTGLALFVLVSLVPAAAAPASGDAATASEVPGGVLVNEFAPSGLFWSTDEFVELRNTGDQLVELEGWELAACLSPSSSQMATVFGPDDEMPPGGYLLLAHPDYADAFGPDPDVERRSG